MKSTAFINTLAERIISDPNIPKKPKKLRKAFKLAVHSLKEGKLKKVLLEKFDSKFDELNSIVQQSVKHVKSGKVDRVKSKTKAGSSKKENIGGETETNGRSCHPFNLYTKNGHTVDVEKLEHLTNAEKANIYQAFLRNGFLTLDEDTVLDTATKCQKLRHPKKISFHKMWQKQMQIICSCIIGDDCPQKLQKVMVIFNQQFATVSEQAYEEDIQSLLYLQATAKQFLMLFHMKHQSQGEEFTGKVSYADLLAGILATYVDICLAIKQRDLTNTSIKKKNLASFILQLLGKNIEHGCDILLQLEKATDNHAQLLLPFAKCVLEKYDSKKCPKLYTKYTLTARMILTLFPTDDVADLRLKVLQIPAPPNYIEWLKEQDSALLDNLPVTKHFQATKITRFMVTEMESDTVEGFLDLLMEESTTAQEEPSKEDEPQANESKTGDLNEESVMFVIDKTPSADTGHLLDDVLKGSKKVVLEKPDDVEEIYISVDELSDSEMADFKMDHDNNTQFVVKVSTPSEENDLIAGTQKVLESIAGDGEDGEEDDDDESSEDDVDSEDDENNDIEVVDSDEPENDETENVQLPKHISNVEYGHESEMDTKKKKVPTATLR